MILSNRHPSANKATKPIDLHVRVAGFGGQGVLLLGEVLAEAGLACRSGSFVAAVLRAGNAFRHFKLPRALVERIN